MSKDRFQVSVPKEYQAAHEGSAPHVGDRIYRKGCLAKMAGGEALAACP